MINRSVSQKGFKSLMITFALCSFLFAAEDVTLSGTVKDVTGKALEGVTVKLSKMSTLSAVTKTDGAFILTNATSVLLPRDLRTSYGVSFRNNAIVFTGISGTASGTVSLYSISGRLVTSTALNNLDAGQLALVFPRLSSGSYVLAGTINGESFTRSLVYSGHDRINSKTTAKAARGKSFDLSKRAAVPVVDTLVFSKDGYITQLWPINKLTRDSIKMVLRATGGKPVVYMTKKLDKEGFLAIYKAIGYDLPGEVMVKVHTGEPDGKYFISSGRMSSVVDLVNGTIVETCLGFTMGTSVFRTTPAKTLQASKDHGFDTIGQGLDIIDTDGEIILPVVGGSQLQGKNYVGANFAKYQSSLVISHFKGHGIVGFGGAIKNVGMGFASPAGKGYLHSGGKVKGTGTTNWTQDKMLVQKAMVEASKSVHDALKGNLVYINTVDNLTLECDCDVKMGAGQGNPLMADIGILGSLDPIAIDQASCDLVLAVTATGGEKLKERINDKGTTKYYGLDGLKYGKTIGLGDTAYTLVDIDK